MLKQLDATFKKVNLPGPSRLKADHVETIKCSNDGRHLMFVISFVFLAEKYALEDSSIACCVPL